MSEHPLAQANAIPTAAVQAARQANYKHMSIVVDSSGNLKAAQHA